MRTEIEVLEQIVDIAEKNDRVRAVYLNGSRVNPNITKDKYQDFDVVFVVTDTKCFLDNKEWLNLFGELAIKQEPDSKDYGWGEEGDDENRYTWLMLFKDDVRIDLTILKTEKALSAITSDTLSRVILDKDKCLPSIPEPSDIGYFVKKPTKEQFKGCCNEFWWCLQNVKKGIERDQLPYAMTMYNGPIRDMLHKMLDWYIGINNDFAVSLGLYGKYYVKYLPEEVYAQYKKTYSDSEYENLWKAIWVSCDLFRKIAIFVGDACGFCYNTDEDNNMVEHLEKAKL